MAYVTRNREYAIESYSPEWSERFEKESEKLRQIFGLDALGIEHVGSTSVEGMDAKATVDMLVVVENINVANKYVTALEALGYINQETFLPQTLLFQKEVEGNRLFILHVFEKRNPHTEELIIARDYLTSHPDEAQKYSEFKRALKAKYPNDYVSYRREKGPYLEELTKRAKKASGS